LLAAEADIVFVVGSKNSSNSNRLREVAALRGIPAYLVDDARDIDPHCLADKHKIGVTAGASAPKVLVDEVISHLRELTHATVRELEGVPEKITFPLPRELS
jgi:4-hydroxy-3-methylbut-2-enyl diphosphate reductase